MTTSEPSRAPSWARPLFPGLAAVVVAAIGLGARGAEPSPVAALVSAVDRTYLYADAPPWQAARGDLVTAGPTNPEAFYARARGILNRVGDPDLHLLSRAQFAAMTQEVDGATSGAGLIDFGIDRDPASGRPRVVTALVGSSAAEAGLKPGDILMRIGMESTEGLDHERVMDLVRARPSTLQVRRGDGLVAIRLKTDVEATPRVVARSVTVGGRAYGYVRVAQFTPGVADAVKKAVREFEVHGIGGYVVDLRNNPGGLLGEAVATGGAFASGRLGGLVRRDGSVEALRSDAALTGKPLVILVNRGTASAAEFMAGALHDMGRAVVAGEPSAGRGQAQTYAPLTDDYGMVIPSAVLETTTGRRFKDRGLLPDYPERAGTLPLARLATRRDPVLQAALRRLVRD